MTLHPYELATLVAVARWVVEGSEGELPPDGMEQLRKVMESYDRAWNGGASISRRHS